MFVTSLEKLNVAIRKVPESEDVVVLVDFNVRGEVDNRALD